MSWSSTCEGGGEVDANFNAKARDTFFRRLDGCEQSKHIGKRELGASKWSY